VAAPIDPEDAAGTSDSAERSAARVERSSLPRYSHMPEGTSIPDGPERRRTDLATPSYPTVLPGQYGPPPSEARPVAAFVVSIVGGMFILLSGIFELWIISAIGTVVYPPGPFGFFALFAIVGIAGGVLVIGFSVLLFSHPQHHVSLGVLILVFSLLSVLSVWGFVIGLVLGIVGGILAIVWTPNRWPTPW
jgi:hypothetical protein